MEHESDDTTSAPWEEGFPEPTSASVPWEESFPEPELSSPFDGAPPLDETTLDSEHGTGLHCTGILPFVACQIMPPPPPTIQEVRIDGTRPAAPVEDERSWCEKYKLFCWGVASELQQPPQFSPAPVTPRKPFPRRNDEQHLLAQDACFAQYEVKTDNCRWQRANGYISAASERICLENARWDHLGCLDGAREAADRR